MHFSTIENLMQQAALSTSLMYELANTDEVLMYLFNCFPALMVHSEHKVGRGGDGKVASSVCCKER
jgi:hypothetical protein